MTYAVANRTYFDASPASHQVSYADFYSSTVPNKQRPIFESRFTSQERQAITAFYALPGVREVIEHPKYDGKPTGLLARLLNALS